MPRDVMSRLESRLPPQRLRSVLLDIFFAAFFFPVAGFRLPDVPRSDRS